MTPPKIAENAKSLETLGVKVKILGEKEIGKLVDTIPLKRLADVVEIAKTVFFLASKDNTYITGQNIVVDGGFTSA